VTSVCPGVPGQVVTLRERPRALIALKRPLTSVGSHVGGQVPFLRKRSGTHFAAKRLLSSVRSRMAIERAAILEDLVAALAGQPLNSATSSCPVLLLHLLWYVHDHLSLECDLCHWLRFGDWVLEGHSYVSSC